MEIHLHFHVQIKITDGTSTVDVERVEAVAEKLQDIAEPNPPQCGQEKDHG